MNPRACLIVALLASTAWSKEPAAVPPALTAGSFDLRNESLRKIVRDTAATQSAIVVASEDAPTKSDPSATFKYVPPEENATPAPVPKTEVPRRKPSRPSNDFVSALFGIALDSVLGDDS